MSSDYDSLLNDPYIIDIQKKMNKPTIRQDTEISESQINMTKSVKGDKPLFREKDIWADSPIGRIELTEILDDFLCKYRIDDTSRCLNQDSGNLFCQVFKVCCNKECIYALKYIPPSLVNEHGVTVYYDHNAFINEVDALRTCGEKNCPKIYGAAEYADENGKKGGIIIMEAMDMSLHKFINHIMEDKRFDKIIEYITTKLSNMIHELHVKGVYHNDLHANNIMVSNIWAKDYHNIQIKIIDFGRATFGRANPAAKPDGDIIKKYLDKKLAQS